MTALERTLATTFRAARWAASQGKPVCPDCFDGIDLEKPVPDPLTPGLCRYRCQVCSTKFSDVKDTAFWTTKPFPLARWAYLVLLGDPGRLCGLTKREVIRCRELSLKVRRSPLGIAWRSGLEDVRITAERLRAACDRQRSAQ